MSKAYVPASSLAPQVRTNYLFAAAKRPECEVAMGTSTYHLRDLIATNTEDGRVVGGDLNAKNSLDQSLLTVAVLAKNFAALDEILKQGRLPVVNLKAVDGLGKTALDYALGFSDGKEIVERISAYAKYHSIVLSVGESSVARTIKVSEGSPGFSTARLDEFEADARRAELERAFASVSASSFPAASVEVAAFDPDALPADGDNELPLTPRSRAALFSQQDAVALPDAAEAAVVDFDNIPADGDNNLPLDDEARAALFETPTKVSEIDVLAVAKAFDKSWWIAVAIALSQDAAVEAEVGRLLPVYKAGEAEGIIARAQKSGAAAVNAEIIAKRKASRATPSAPAFGSPGDFVEAAGGDGEEAIITEDGRKFAAVISEFGEVEIAALAYVYHSSELMREKLSEASRSGKITKPC